MRHTTVIDSIRESGVVITILTGSVDEKIALEIGAAVLLGKPIIGVCFNGYRPEGRLLSILDTIVDATGGMSAAVAANVRDAVLQLCPEELERLP